MAADINTLLQKFSQSGYTITTQDMVNLLAIIAQSGSAEETAQAAANILLANPSFANSLLPPIADNLNNPNSTDLPNTQAVAAALLQQANDFSAQIATVSEQASTSIVDVAETTTVPIDTTNKFVKYSVDEAGTFANFPDASGTPIVVLTAAQDANGVADLDKGLVELWGKNGVWNKNITPISLAAYARKSYVGIAKEDTAETLSITIQLIQGYTLFSGGIDTGNGSTTGWLRTVPVNVVSGVPNVFYLTGFTPSNSKNLNYYKADGTFIANVKLTTALPYTLVPPADAAYWIANVKEPADATTPTNATLTSSFVPTTQVGNSPVKAATIFNNQSSQKAVGAILNDAALIAADIAKNSDVTPASKNILNEAEIVPGYVSSTGIDDRSDLNANSWRRTGKVYCSENTNYIFSVQSGFTTYSKNLAFFKKDGTRISTVQVTANPFLFITPAGTSYLIMTLVSTDVIIKTIEGVMICPAEADKPNEYIGYSPATIKLLYNKYAIGSFSNSGNNGNGTVQTSEVWYNHYVNVYQDIPNFIQKYLNKAGMTAENFIRIIMDGDSLFAREMHTDILGIDPTSMPPTFTTKMIGAYLWLALKGNLPIYSRYDKTGRFTETGTWSTVSGLSNWDEGTYVNGLTRRSTDSNAAFSFTVPAAVTYFNLIDRTDSQSCTNVTIQVSANGILQVKLEGGTWVEANGFSFSQLEPPATANKGNSTYQRRILFKKVGSGKNTDVPITIKKGTADGSALMYWGIEEVQGSRPYVQLINVARGSHTLDMLSKYINNDVVSRNPDLVILELPLLNMIATNSTIAYNVNWVQDYVFGDRSGATNMWALKKQLPNTDIMMIIPHHSHAHYNADSTSLLMSGGFTCDEIYQSVKSFLYSRDIHFVDIASALEAEIDADPLFNGNYYAGTAASSNDGNTYLKEGTHANNKGAKVWAKHLCPIFRTNTF